MQRAGLSFERKLHSGCWPILLYALIFVAGFYMRNHPESYPTYAWEGIFTLAFLYEGTYCVRNFIHCRESHCIVTGSGWTIIGIASLLSTAKVLSYSNWGYYWLGFFAVYVAGMSFQFVYYQLRHTYQLR